MNLRALILFAAVLLMQAGQGVALIGGTIRAEAATEPCHMSCCDGLTVAQGCCCMERPASAPAPATPAPPPAPGRDLVPVIPWTAVVSANVSLLPVSSAADSGFHFGAAHTSRAKPVSLAVLHCTFLL